MNPRLVNAAAGVICAAQKVDRTPAGIALALASVQLLQSPEAAAELAALRKRVAEMQARIDELLKQRDDALVDLVAEGAAGVEPEQQNTTADDEQAAPCRCDEPGADPYDCEADDCAGYFSELNPHGAGARPVDVASAEVSRTCRTCGWRTSVWHVDDGSAEAELHGHVTRVHRSSPAAAGAGESA